VFVGTIPLGGLTLPGAWRAQPANPMTVSAKAPCPRSRKRVRLLITLVDPVMAPALGVDVTGRTTRLAPPDGFEPPTPAFGRLRSIH
jgi:hypothetical protein